MKSAATGYADYFKKNSSGATTDSNDPIMKTPEDKKKDAIRRRLMKRKKFQKSTKTDKTMKEF